MMNSAMTTINATTTIDLTEDMRNEAQRRFSALFIEYATEELLMQEQPASQPVPEKKYLSPPPATRFKRTTFRRSEAALCQMWKMNVALLKL